MTLHTISRCERCGHTQHDQPKLPCERCEKDNHWVAVRELCDRAESAVPVTLDPYSGGLIAWCDDGRVIRIRDAAMFIRCGERADHEMLIADNVELRDENKELLVENAKLRRALDRKK